MTTRHPTPHTEQLAIGGVRPETPREAALRSTQGRGYWTKHEAVRLMYARVAERRAAGNWPPNGRTQ